jgi:hypothetical protein
LPSFRTSTWGTLLQLEFLPCHPSSSFESRPAPPAAIMYFAHLRACPPDSSVDMNRGIAGDIGRSNGLGAGGAVEIVEQLCRCMSLKSLNLWSRYNPPAHHPLYTNSHRRFPLCSTLILITTVLAVSTCGGGTADWYHDAVARGHIRAWFRSRRGSPCCAASEGG